MTLEDIAKVAITILAAIGSGGALVLALSSWLGKIWAGRLMAADKARHAKDLKELESELSRASEDRTRKLESLMGHYQRQIEEFYGPLFNMVNQVFVANHVLWAIVGQVDDQQAEQVRDYFNETYFDPMHADIRQILKTKLYLVEGPSMPHSFYLYLKHAAQERDQRTLWKLHGINTAFLKGEPWPDAFYDDIRGGFDIAMKNYERCLDGLKA